MRYCMCVWGGVHVCKFSKAVRVSNLDRDKTDKFIHLQLTPKIHGQPDTDYPQNKPEAAVRELGDQSPQWRIGDRCGKWELKQDAPATASLGCWGHEAATAVFPTGIRDWDAGGQQPRSLALPQKWKWKHLGGPRVWAWAPSSCSQRFSQTRYYSFQRLPFHFQLSLRKGVPFSPTGSLSLR